MIRLYDFCYDCKHAARQIDYKSTEQKISFYAAGDALAWYVSTGRSCREFDVAVERANLKKLIAYMANHSVYSNDYTTLIRVAKQYLKRYCKLHYSV